MYFEHNIHDNLCVVHSLNNVLQNIAHIPKITPKKLMEWSNNRGSAYYDKYGFDINLVLRNLRRHTGIYFKLIKPYKNIMSYNRGCYLISVHKHDYNHMISVVKGEVLDNEDRNIHNVLDLKKYKILDVHKLELYNTYK